jgi:protein-serine/threonine kinase
MPEAKKRQETEALLKKESKFLRFLRTKETPSNFQTIKFIGKAAFGEAEE